MGTKKSATSNFRMEFSSFIEMELDDELGGSLAHPRKYARQRESTSGLFDPVDCFLDLFVINPAKCGDLGPSEEIEGSASGRIQPTDRFVTGE